MKKSIGILVLLILACCLLSSCNTVHYDRNELLNTVSEIKLVDCGNTAYDKEVDSNRINLNDVKVLYKLPGDQLESFIDKFSNIKVSTGQLFAPTENEPNGVCLVLIYKDGNCEILSLNGCVAKLEKDSTSPNSVGWLNAKNLSLLSDVVIEYFVADVQ